MSKAGQAVSGTCDAAFEPLRDLLERNLAEGAESGASVAVVQDGRLVADVWGGQARPGRPWQRDTLVQTWSVSKTMAALTVLCLADQGVIDVDAPVSAYWPDFTDDSVLVRHLLAHTSGMAGWQRRVSIAEVLDLDYSERLLAAQQPWWPPGTASGYHALNYGHLLDGLVRAATEEALSTQFHRLIAEPLGADFHLGLADTEHDRCADLIPPPARSGGPITSAPADLPVYPMTNPMLDIATDCNSPAWRKVSVAGANGHGNARSIALAQAPVSHGGCFRGTRVLSPAMIDRIFETQADGIDKVLQVPVRFGIGYALPKTAAYPAIPDAKVCWWTGFGGAVVINDLERQATIAYAMNRMDNHITTSSRTDGYIRTAYACLDEARPAAGPHVRG